MSWLRLEGSNRDPELAEGLAAETADPLWSLARQWQVGEFHGEDAASPIIVTADVVDHPHHRVRPWRAGRQQRGAGPSRGRPPARGPRRGGTCGRRRAAVAERLAGCSCGLCSSTGVADDGVAALRSREYGLSLPVDDGLDPVGRAELELLARRSVDGWRIAAGLRRTTPVSTPCSRGSGPPATSGARIDGR